MNSNIKYREQKLPNYYEEYNSIKNKEQWKKCIDDVRIAIQVHAYYPDLTKEIVRYLNNIPIPFDLFISTDTIPKMNEIEKTVQSINNARNIKKYISENKGRDVGPFIIQMGDYIDDYDYICHIHTKKSKHLKLLSSGDEWRKYLLDNLLGSKDFVKSIIEMFENNSEIGVICPHTFKPMLPNINWGGNLETSRKLLEKVCKEEIQLPDKPDFPAGNMLWFRTQAAMNLFCSDIQLSDFEDEMGQLDGTLAHSIERCWFYIADFNGYSSLHYNYKKQPLKFNFDILIAKAEQVAISVLNKLPKRNKA